MTGSFEVKAKRALEGRNERFLREPGESVVVDFGDKDVVVSHSAE